MAVPKKKTSKSKSLMRNANWKKTASNFTQNTFIFLKQEFKVSQSKIQNKRKRSPAGKLLEYSFKGKDQT